MIHYVGVDIIVSSSEHTVASHMPAYIVIKLRHVYRDQTSITETVASGHDIGGYQIAKLLEQ